MSLRTMTGTATAGGGGDTGSGPGRPSRRVVLAVVAGAVVVVGVLLVWLVAFSPVLGVRTVSVRGNHALTSAEVEAAADIAHGSPLVRLDTAAIAARIEHALPQVADARVSASFPSTVVIQISERAPVGYVERDGRYALVDRTGDEYTTVRSRPASLPRFVLPSGGPARAAGAAVARVAAALPASLRAKVNSIQALDPKAITLLLRDHRVVAWGTADRSADKAKVLVALLPHTKASIDVSDPDQPFTR